MDPNKKDEVVQNPQPQDPGYTNDDLQKQSVRDIASGQEPPVEPAKPEEKGGAEPVVTPPVVDEEAQKKIAEDAARKVLEEQETQRKAQEEEENKKKQLSEEENAYASYEKELWEKEKRQPTYREALDFMMQQAEKRWEAKQEEARKTQEEEQNRIKTQQEETNKQVNAMVDDELEDLYKAEKLTRVKDANNPSDQGVVERKALFTKWYEVNEERRSKGLPEITSATRIYEFYFQKPNAQPPGSNAPVAGNKGAINPPSSEQNYTYQDIRRPWSFFKRNQ